MFFGLIPAASPFSSQIQTSWLGVLGFPCDGEPIAGPLSATRPNILPAAPPTSAPIHKGSGDEGSTGANDVAVGGSRVWVVGGFCGHGMPRCFGLAEITAKRLLGIALSPEDIETAAKFDVGRLFDNRAVLR